jgi:hypothetical protein
MLPFEPACERRCADDPLGRNAEAPFDLSHFADRAAERIITLTQVQEPQTTPAAEVAALGWTVEHRTAIPTARAQKPRSRPAVVARRALDGDAIIESIVYEANMIHRDVNRDGTGRVLTQGRVGVVTQHPNLHAHQVFTTEMVVTSVSHGRKIIREFSSYCNT